VLTRLVRAPGRHAHEAHAGVARAGRDAGTGRTDAPAAGRTAIDTGLVAILHAVITGRGGALPCGTDAVLAVGVDGAGAALIARTVAESGD